MRKLFQIVLLTAVFLVVSCGGSNNSQTSCPTGYTWSGSDCVKTSDQDGNTDTTDTDSQKDPDKDSADDSDSNEENDTDSEENDNENTAYTGTCTEIGDSYEINVETKKLTIGTITVNGTTDDEHLYGELWAENKATLSEFKVDDITSELSGKVFDFPKGRYSFYFKPVSSANKLPLNRENGGEEAEEIEIKSSDVTLNINLPLYHLTGKVLNNSGETFTVDAAYQESTQLVLKTGTFEKVVPYGEFAGYDLLLPKGKYSVYFKGQLAAGQPMFAGTVFSSENGIDLKNDAAEDIKIKTINFAGSIKEDATSYHVSGGKLILVENPPFGSESAVVAADLSTATSYNVTVTEGADLSLLYLPTDVSYPTEYMKLESWNSTTETPSAHDIILDFALIHGKITFRGGNNFPSVTKCKQADCTIGKLKASGEYDFSSFVVKNFGTTLEVDENGDVTYEALLVRRLATKITDSNGSRTEYSPKKYKMTFESHLNDVEGIFSYSPFSVPATYTKNDEQISSFSFQNTTEEYILDENGNRVTDEESGEYLTTPVVKWENELTIDFDIAPRSISGSVTLNGSTFSTESKDLIKLRDENGTEYPVINLSELSDGKYSFFAPENDYDVIYEGDGILSSEFKTFIERSMNVSTSDEENHELTLKTGKVKFNFNVNEMPFADWITEATPNLESYGFAVNIDKTVGDFVFPLSKKDDTYSAEILTGVTINGYLELVFKDNVNSQKSFSRIQLLSSHNFTADKKVDTDCHIADFDFSVKLNGSPVSAADYAAELKIQGVNNADVFCSGENPVKVLLKQGEYKSSVPKLYLNEGFGTKQEIALECLYFGK